MARDIEGLSRVIASHPHLRILKLLSEEGDATPKVVPEEMRIHHSVASRHLADLARCGRARGKVVGAMHQFALSEESDSLAADALLMLQPLLYKLEYSDGIPLTASLILNAATGFTYERRVRIYAFLTAHRGLRIPEIGFHLGIPNPSVQRHLVKLRARDYITAFGDRHVRQVSLTAPRSVIHYCYAERIAKELARK